MFFCSLCFQDILRSDGDTACEAKVLKCVLNHMRGRKGAEKTKTSLSKWLVMRMKMDGLDASVCHTSWATSLGCPAGGSLFLCLFSTSNSIFGLFGLYATKEIRKFELDMMVLLVWILC